MLAKYKIMKKYWHNFRNCFLSVVKENEYLWHNFTLVKGCYNFAFNAFYFRMNRNVWECNNDPIFKKVSTLIDKTEMLSQWMRLNDVSFYLSGVFNHACTKIRIWKPSYLWWIKNHFAYKVSPGKHEVN